MKVANEQMEEALRQKQEREANQTQEPTEPKQTKTSNKRVKVDSTQTAIANPLDGRALARQQVRQALEDYADEMGILMPMLGQAIGALGVQLTTQTQAALPPAKDGQTYTMEALLGEDDDE